MKDSNTKSVSFQSHALDLARYNLRVHPLIPNSKKPLLKSCLRIATTDNSVISDWAVLYPNANIGIVPEPFALVLDIDRRNGGHISLAGLEATYGPLPDTWRVETGDGEHLYFSALQHPVKSTELLSGIDIISCHNLVAPGSIVNGHTYRWKVGLSPDEIELASLPEHLMNLLKDRGLFSSNDKSVASKGDPFLLATSPAATAVFPNRTGVVRAEIATLFSQEDVVRRCLNHMDILALIGKAFSCPFHPPDNNPSAYIRKPNKPGGAYMFVDAHKGGVVWPLANIYYAFKTGNVPEKLPKSSFLIWTVRLLIDAGVLENNDTAVPSLAGASDITRRVYAGFCLLMRVRRYLKNGSTPFSWNFASAWCAVTYREVQGAIKWLMQRGYMRAIGRYGGNLSLFTLGAKDYIERMKRKGIRYLKMSQTALSKVSVAIGQTVENAAAPTTDPLIDMPSSEMAVLIEANERLKAKRKVLAYATSDSLVAT